MLELLKKIEEQCNFTLETHICGINFKLNVQRLYSKLILNDMLHYLPDVDIKGENTSPVKLYYFYSSDMLQIVKKYPFIDNGEKIVIYNSRSVHKEALHFRNDKIDVFYCGMEPYFIITYEDKIFIIINQYTKSKQRLYFRVIIEFILRIKEREGFLLLHAAGISYKKQGILICGNKGAGKTTLLSHCLRLGRFDFLGNDKMLLSPDLRQLQYFPLVIRVGDGTARTFEEYDLFKQRHRTTEDVIKKGKLNFGDDKWEFTPKELTNMFKCHYSAEADFNKVLLPCINDQKNEAKVIEVDNARYDILNYNLFNNDNKYQVDNWLLNDFWLSCIEKKHQTKIDKQKFVKVYIVEYGYKSTEDEMKVLLEKILV